MSERRRFFATAAKGTEGAVRDELRELRFRGVKATRGGVHFEGALVEGYRACLWLRCASRVLLDLGEVEAPTGDALYEGISTFAWGDYVSPRQTLAVRATSKDSALTHTQFIAQRTKDAIVDRIRAQTGARPSVDREDPDVGVFVHLVRDRASIHLDLAGEPLHLRGYRPRAAPAPLKETLAASILRLSGWDRQRALWDPMCGSGTLPIEAAQWATGVAPGIARERFGFERWASHDDEARRRVARLREEARASVRKDGPTVRGTDADERAVVATRQNARRAKVRVLCERMPIADLAPREPDAFLVMNPPYGERLEPERALYRTLGEVLLGMHGHDVAILCGTPDIPRAIPQRSESAHELFNGAIRCRLVRYRIR